MSNTLSHFTFGNACADISCFDNGTEVREYQAIIHISQQKLSYTQQLEAIMTAYNKLLETLPDTQAVFKRYFLSDAANQADDVIVNDVTDCAKSIIEQPPLDGTKIALWVYAAIGWYKDCPLGLSHDECTDRCRQERTL